MSAKTKNGAPTESAEFDPSQYLAKNIAFLEELPKYRGHVTFSSLRDTYPDQLGGLYDEHVLNGLDASDYGGAADAHLSFSEYDSMVGLIEDVSRASAILQKEDPEFVRLGELPDANRHAVMDSIIQSVVASRDAK